MKYIIITLSMFLLSANINAQVKRNTGSKITKLKAPPPPPTPERLALSLKNKRKKINELKALFPTKKPAYVFYDSVYSELTFADTLNIIAMKPIMPKAAVKKYGAKAVNGVIEVEAIIKVMAMDESEANDTAVAGEAPAISEKNKIEEKEDTLKVHDKVEVEARYSGSWIKFLQTNLSYPEEAIKKNIKGAVTILFIVERDGTIQQVRMSDYSVQKNTLLVNEAIRVIKLSNGEWLPGLQDGKPVRSYHEQTISFVL